MILSAMFAATILLAETTPAAATAAAAPATAAKAAEAPKAKPKMVCQTEAVTGSMFPKKTCYNVEDMAMRRQEERKNLQIMQNTQRLDGN